MATHRQQGPADPPPSDYSAGAYRNVDYPHAGPGYPADSTAERRYAERIPRYPDGAPSGTREGAPPPDEELRLIADDLPGARPNPPTSGDQSARYSTPTAPSSGEQPGNRYTRPNPPSSGEQSSARYAGSNPPTAPTSPAPPARPVSPSAPPVPTGVSDEPTATYPAARPAPTPPQPPTSQQPAPQPPAEPAPQPQSQPQPQPQPQPAGAPYQQAQQAQQQPGTPLSELLHDATQYTEPVGPYPTTPAPTRDDGVYRAGGRPQLAWLLAAAAVLFEIPVVFVLVRSLAASGIVVSGVVSGLLLLPGVPLFAAGLYHLFSGHIAVRPGEGAAALTRRPLAVLLVGTVLLVAGAMAAG